MENLIRIEMTRYRNIRDPAIGRPRLIVPSMAIFIVLADVVEAEVLGEFPRVPQSYCPVDLSHFLGRRIPSRRMKVEHRPIAIRVHFPSTAAERLWFLWQLTGLSPSLRVNISSKFTRIDVIDLNQLGEGDALRGEGKGW